MSKKERGRPMCSHHVRIVPEYRDTPDMEKLGKALISVAVTIAGKKRAEQTVLRTGQSYTLRFIPCRHNRKEGGMT